jgi:2-polyprenyl-6-methoxyphenol hydroxylase-like FAD-dependent oxidoreductase
MLVILGCWLIPGTDETGQYLGPHKWSEEMLHEARGEFVFVHVCRFYFSPTCLVLVLTNASKHSDFRRFLYRIAIRYGAKIHLRSNVVQVNPLNRSVKLASGQTFRGDVIIAADGPSSLARQQQLKGEGKSDPSVKNSQTMMYR